MPYLVGEKCQYVIVHCLNSILWKHELIHSLTSLNTPEMVVPHFLMIILIAVGTISSLDYELSLYNFFVIVPMTHHCVKGLSSSHSVH